MKIDTASAYDRVSPRGTKAVRPSSGKPAKQSGLDIAPNPELSPRRYRHDHGEAKLQV